MELAQLGALAISATSLNVLDRCPRLFRYLFVDQLLWPPGQALEEEENLYLGQLFHRLIELHTRGRSVDSQVQAAGDEVQQWWEVFLTSPHAQPQGQVFSEIPLWVQAEGIILTGQIDRLQITEAGIEIIDWKTDQLRPSDGQILRNRQIWLYPLMIDLVREHRPDFPSGPIQITFWYVRHPEHPFRKSYGADQLHHHRQVLHQEITTLKRLHQEEYPMTPYLSTCQFCLFRTRCYGLAPEGLDPQQLELFESLIPAASELDPDSV